MNDVDVSIVIPTFHREAELLEAIGSVLCQSGVTLQIIVVDDSAGQTARAAVESVQDPRIHYIARREPSGGRPALVRNEGGNVAQGRYIYFLDDDDLMRADTLRTMVAALDAAPTAGMAFGLIEPFGKDEKVLRGERRYFHNAGRIARRLWGAWELGARLVFLPALLVNSACMLRRTAFLASGGYDAEIPICEDAEFWGRIAHATGYVFIDQPVVRYRTGAPSLMHNLAPNDEKLHTSYRRIQDKYRRAHGLLNFIAMKLWTRVILQRLDPSDSASVAFSATVQPEIAFRAHQGLPGLQQLTREWTSLVATIPGASFNHLPCWYHAYLASRDCDPASVWFITAHRGERLVAVCPLQFQRHRVPLLRPRYLGTLDGNELQLSDFVFAPSTDNSSLVFELTRWLRVQRRLRWDVLRLLKVAENSSLGYAARTRRPRLTLAANYDASAYFDTRGSYDQATHAMASKMRSNLRRRTRLAESAAPLRFESCRGPADVARGFDIFLELESSGWKGAAGNRSAIRCVPSVLAFYTAIVREFTARNECVVNLLWHGEEPIAAQLGLHLGRTLYILKVGYRDTHPVLAPGILLQDRTIRYACEDPDVDVLSMVNNPPWLHSFKTNTVNVSMYCVFNWTVAGLLAQLGMWMKRSWFAPAPESATLSAHDI